MRSGRDVQWLIVDGKMIGISLGADFCSEHEWGIQELKRALGIDGYVGEFSRDKPKYTKPHGIARRTITKHDMVKLYEHDGATLLICEDRWWFERFDGDIKKNPQTFKDDLPSDLRSGLREKKLTAAWDGESFGVLAYGEDAVKVRELYEEFRKDQVAIWIGGRAMAFENGGLIICIVDRVPADKAAMLKEGDLKAERLQAASDATGIIQRLEAAKKGYFACSPRWLTDEATKSAYPVVYWLNPTDQHENNFGWYTVEDLDAWIAGRGPIPMKNKVSKS